MASETCGCGDKGHDGCAACGQDDIFGYWCETCKRSVAEKRCPFCGLKAQKKKIAAG